jgi:hypothetical protein
LVVLFIATADQFDEKIFKKLLKIILEGLAFLVFVN